MPIIIADKNGSVDSVYHTLLKHIPTDKILVVVSWAENFVFNDALLSIKDYILICFCEYGWDWDLNKSGSHIWGINSEKFPRYYNGDWVKFDNWVKNNPPKLVFKRELLEKDVSDKVLPIEYPCVSDVWDTETEEEFNKRPINVFQYWGRSNECRLRIHSEIWLHAFNKGFQPCDNIYYIDGYLKNESGEKWITLWVPHWARVELDSLLPFNNLSKLSLSWPGAGFKCFRTGESPVNSVLVMHKNSFSWAYKWDEKNCILVEPGKEIEGIEQGLKNKNLYDIYLEGMKTVDKYRTNNYINNYLLPHINSI